MCCAVAGEGEKHEKEEAHADMPNLEVCDPHTYPMFSNTPPHPAKPGPTCRSERVAKAAIHAGLEG